jgi:hypothetical protein
MLWGLQTWDRLGWDFSVGVWQRVAIDSLKFHLGLPCPSLLRPVGGPPLKRPCSSFWGGPPAERAACGRLLLFWTPHVVRLSVSGG